VGEAEGGCALKWNQTIEIEIEAKANWRISWPNLMPAIWSGAIGA